MKQSAHPRSLENAGISALAAADLKLPESIRHPTSCLREAGQKVKLRRRHRADVHTSSPPGSKSCKTAIGARIQTIQLVLQVVFLPAATSELQCARIAIERTCDRHRCRVHKFKTKTPAAAMPQLLCAESEDVPGYFVAAPTAGKLLLRSVNDVHSCPFGSEV